MEVEMSEIKERVLKVLDNVGIFLESDDDDVRIIDFGIDSLTFIVLVTEIEKEFSIQIPDEYMNFDLLLSLKTLCNMIETVMCRDEEFKVYE